MNGQLKFAHERAMIVGVGLPSAQKTELLLFAAQSLRAEQAPLPEPRRFSDEQLRTWMDEDEEAMRRFRAGA